MAIRSLASVLLLLCGLALIAVTAAGYFAPADDARVTVDDPDREVPACTPGQATEVAFRVHNPTGRSVQLVGLAEC
jgi:uncharacterized protein (DUF58 family)